MISSAVATSGLPAVIQTVPVTEGGQHTITLAGVGTETGLYQVRVILNAAVELETYGGPANDDTTSAQDLNAAFVDLSAGTVQRAAVVGEVGGDLADYYAFTLGANQTSTIAVHGAGSAVELLDSGGTAVAAGVRAGNVSGIISDFVAPAAGTYYARVTRDVPGEYRLMVTRDASFDTESNNDLASAQSIDATGVVLGYVSAVGQLLGADDGDRNLLLVDPATGTATIVASNVGGGAGFNDLALNPVTGILYGSQSLANPGLYTIDTVSFEETFIGNLGGNVRALAWSPDGTTLYGFRDFTFGTIDPATAQFTDVGDPGIGFVGGIAFQPGTGTLFAVTNVRGRSRSVHTRSNHRRRHIRRRSWRGL